MKNYLILISFLALFIGCQTAPPVETDLYIYLDFTEGQDYTNQFNEDIEAYKELLHIEEAGSSNFGKVKIFPLYDLTSARSKTIKLKEGKSEFETNKFLRQKKVDQFQVKLLGALTEINDTYTGKALNKSHLIEPICKGIQKLNNSDANRKVVLIYSDMLENSNIANFHAKKGNDKIWTKKIDKACNPEDVSNLEIFVVYPVDKKTDEKISNAAKFWTDYFASKGADEETFHFETGIDL